MSDLKMSDVFDGDVINDADSLIAEGYGELADFSGYKRECRYAAHAINSHDKLRTENEALRESLKLAYLCITEKRSMEGDEFATVQKLLEGE